MLINNLHDSFIRCAATRMQGQNYPEQRPHALEETRAATLLASALWALSPSAERTTGCPVTHGL